VPQKGPLPAHLLGNIWAQDWSNVYDLVAPANADAGFSLTDILKRRKMSAIDMVKAGERFYSSIGLAPLPPTFWERSLFVRPKDREVVCHASAWDIDSVNDVRIKMCIDQTAEDFSTIHHELGHNYYQRAYNTLPMIFRDSANDGFHEAIGDTIALSVTPEYLVKIGLLDKAPDASRDIGLLLSRALSVASESVNEIYAAMDSVFVGSAERQVASFTLEGGGKMLVEELLSWVVTFTSDEAPKLVYEGGRRGVEAILPTAEQLDDLVSQFIAGLGSDPSLPQGLRHPRVRYPLMELRTYLQQIQQLAQDVRTPV